MSSLCFRSCLARPNSSSVTFSRMPYLGRYSSTIDANEATIDRFLCCRGAFLSAVLSEKPWHGLPPEMRSTSPGRGTSAEYSPSSARANITSAEPTNGCTACSASTLAMYVCTAVVQMSLAQRVSTARASSRPRPRLPQPQKRSSARSFLSSAAAASDQSLGASSAACRPSAAAVRTRPGHLRRKTSAGASQRTGCRRRGSCRAAARPRRPRTGAPHTGRSRDPSAARRTAACRRAR